MSLRTNLKSSRKSIRNFDELGKALRKADYDYDTIDLSENEVKTLQEEILKFTESVMKNATDVLEDYYSMSVPIDFIKNILTDDIKLAYEVYSGGVGDTCQRELMVDAVLKAIKMRRWPINSEGDEVFKNFVKELEVKATKNGIKLK